MSPHHFQVMLKSRNHVAEILGLNPLFGEVTPSFQSADQQWRGGSDREPFPPGGWGVLASLTVNLQL